LGRDLDECRDRTQFSEILIVLAGFLTLEIASQDDDLATENTIQSLGVVNAKHLGEAQFDLSRRVASHDLAAKREVKFIHLAPDFPCSFL
jgi:hypothetical protein